MATPPGFDRRVALRLFGIFVLVVLLWSTPVVAPLKIFVVLLHELSHGLAAVLTGGSIRSIEVSAAQGGVCYTSGGSRFAVLSAGYLGSMLWGGVIMLAAAKTRYDRHISVVIGVAVLLVTLIYVRSWFGFGFALVSSLALIAVGVKLSHDTNELILKTVGLTSCLYAVLDIWDDVIARDIPSSDASKLGELTHLPGELWGVIWIAVALAASGAFVWMSVRE